MRITIDLPEDLHRVLASLAVDARTSMDVVAVDAIRRGLGARGGDRSGSGGVGDTSTVTGLPLVYLPKSITPADVKALEADG